MTNNNSDNWDEPGKTPGNSKQSFEESFDQFKRDTEDGNLMLVSDFVPFFRGLIEKYGMTKRDALMMATVTMSGVASLIFAQQYAKDGKLELTLKHMGEMIKAKAQQLIDRNERSGRGLEMLKDVGKISDEEFEKKYGVFMKDARERIKKFKRDNGID